MYFDYDEWKKERIANGEVLDNDTFRSQIIMKKQREIIDLKRKWNMIELRSRDLLLGRETRSYQNRQIILDTETTGFYNSDAIVELSMLEIVNGKYTGSFFHSYFNPIIKVSEGAQSIHKLTNDRLKDEPLFESKVEDIIKFISHSKIVAHNSNFDMRMLNNELNRYGWESYSNEYFIDTLKLSRQLFQGEKNNLDALCKRFNIQSNRLNNGIHSALEDTFLLFEVYKKLMDHK